MRRTFGRDCVATQADGFGFLWRCATSTNGTNMRFHLLRHLFAWAMFLSAVAMVAGQPARAASPLALKFVVHASFFSEETHQPNALDPQAFVKDPSVPSAVG